MPKELSLEKRGSIIAAILAGEPVAAVARRVGIAKGTAYDLLRLYRQTGSLAPRPHNSTWRSKLSDADREALRSACLAAPELSQRALADWLAEERGVRVSQSIIGKELRRLGVRQVPVPREGPLAEPPPRRTRAYRCRPRGPRLAARPGYPSDLSDEEWRMLEPLIPAPKSGGRPVEHHRRDIVEAILYVLRTGCQWRALPHDFPPWPTVYDLFRKWGQLGIWERANDILREGSRRRDGRNARPSAAIIDSQSVKTTEKGGPVATMEASD